MKRNLTISVDEQVLERLKAYSRKLGKSLNAYVGEILDRSVPENRDGALEEFFRLGDGLGVDLTNVKPWTRDELYDR